MRDTYIVRVVTESEYDSTTDYYGPFGKVSKAYEFADLVKVPKNTVVTTYIEYLMAPAI